MRFLAILIVALSSFVANAQTVTGSNRLASVNEIITGTVLPVIGATAPVGAKFFVDSATNRITHLVNGTVWVANPASQFPQIVSGGFVPTGTPPTDALLYWNPTSNRFTHQVIVGVWTAIPDAPDFWRAGSLTGTLPSGAVSDTTSPVYRNGGVVIDSPTDQGLVVKSGALGTAYLERYSTGNAPDITFTRGRGTSALPLPALTNDVLGTLWFYPYVSDGSKQVTAFQRVTACENHTPTARGTKIEFGAAVTGLAAVSKRLFIDCNGYVGIGNGATANSSLQLNGAVQTSASTYAANTTQIDTNSVVYLNSTTPFTYTLLPATALIAGREITIKNISAGAVTHTITGPINAAAISNYLLPTGASVKLVVSATNLMWTVSATYDPSNTNFTSTTTSLTVNDTMGVINVNNGFFTNVTITLPTPIGRAGKSFIVKRDQGSTATVTVATAAGSIQALNGSFGATVNLAGAGNYGQSMEFISDNVNWHRKN